MPGIAVVCPRNMHFGPRRATSIDLCAYDWSRFSRFRDRTTVFGAPVEEPFPELDFQAVEPAAGQRRWARRLGERLRLFRPDLVEVHQHLPTAARVARMLPGVPVVAVRHGFMPVRGPLHRLRLRHALAPLAGLVFVSEALRASFAADWPRLAARSVTVPNGLDTERWHPAAAPRQPLLLFVGRVVPEKGVLEFAEAAVRTLARAPGWRAMIIGGPQIDEDPPFFSRVRRAAAAAGERFAVAGPLPFDAVMDWVGRAEIAVVPSLLREAFGRTALEAQAVGAALVSSGRGGLREISGDAALYPTTMDADGLAAAMLRYIEDPRLRAEHQRLGRERVAALFDIRVVAARLDAVRARHLGAG